MIYVINYMAADPAKKEKAWDWLTRFAAYNTNHGVQCKAMWNMTGGQKGPGKSQDMLDLIVSHKNPECQPMWTMTGELGEMMLLHTYDSIEHWGEYCKFVNNPEHGAFIQEMIDERYFPGSWERHVFGVADPIK